MGVGKRTHYAWALYDWANSAFATTVMAGLFPVFFKQYWAKGLSAGDSTYQLGVANTVASLIILLTAPLLGVFADRGGSKKRWLTFCMLIGVMATALFFWIPLGAWRLAASIYVMAFIGFSASLIFYDALLVDIAVPAERHRVSALGYGLGYLGGGLLLAANVLATLHPQWFGLQSSAAAVRFSFLSVAIWWLLFSLPLLIYVKEEVIPAISIKTRLLVTLKQLQSTALEICGKRATLLFLLGYWFYIDGVDTVIRMAVDYGMSLGFASSHLITALLITQFVGLPATLLFGRLAERYSASTGIFIGIMVYVIITIWGYFMQSVYEFYGLAFAVGTVQGGVQALSRSLYAELIPPGRATEFFGFYNMFSKFAAIAGPVLIGIIAKVSMNPRLSILAVLPLFMAGSVFLLFSTRVKHR